jgi:UDP-N-acetylglucosamine acyltransferase
MAEIHPTALVHPGAKLAAGVKVDAYAVIASPHVELEEGVVVKPHVYIDGNVKVGKGTVIWPFASIGSQTQDLKYRGETTYVEIGQQCQIREYVTINSSCGEGTKVVVGNNCLLMAYCHVAHNCTIGNGVIMANSATLAGHVHVGNYVTLGGICALHQYTRIGDYAMVGGGSMVAQDIPPYCICSGYPAKVAGLNIIGLKRRKFPIDLRKMLIRAYRITYQSGLSWKEAREVLLLEMGDEPFVEKWVEFCDQTKRGLAIPRCRGKARKALTSAELLSELENAHV